MMNKVQKKKRKAWNLVKSKEISEGERKKVYKVLKKDRITRTDESYIDKLSNKISRDDKKVNLWKKDKDKDIFRIVRAVDKLSKEDKVGFIKDCVDKLFDGDIEYIDGGGDISRIKFYCRRCRRTREKRSFYRLLATGGCHCWNYVR